MRATVPARSPRAMGVVDDVSARIAWAALAEPDDRWARELAQEHGPLGALDRVLSAAGAAGATRPADALTRTADRVAPRLRDLHIGRLQEMSDRLGARVLVPQDEEWPGGLDDLEDPPWCLWVSGPTPLADACQRSVAVVGSRAATHYGTFVTGEIAGGLAVRGFTVVSGAAFGVDAAAHRATLGSDGCTLAVLAGGVDRDYPSGHRDLLAQIRGSGAVLSEMPPGRPPSKFRFLARNRLIAALTGGTVVVEAGLRSGARTTARRAAELGRPVGAVPGPVTSMTSAGCHELIRDGLAVLVTDAEEAAELVGTLGADLAEVKRGAERPGDRLDELPRRVLAALPHHTARTADDIASVAGLALGEVLTGLGELEAEGLVEHRLDGWGQVRRR